MRYLIVGGSGFVGTNMTNIIEHSVIFDLVKSASPLSFIKGDVRSSEDIARCPPTNGVVHLAARTGHRVCEEKPQEAFDVNVRGTENVLEYCRKHDVPLVFASTCGVYGAFTQYTETKMIAEGLIFKHSQVYDLPHVVLRFANIYGPHMEDKSSVIPTFIRQAESGENLTVEGDGTQTRDFVHVRDVCRTIVNALEYGKSSLFNVGTGVEVSINRLAKIISEKYDVGVKHVDMPSWRGDKEGCMTQSNGLPIEKTVEEINPDGFRSLEEGLGDLL